MSLRATIILATGPVWIVALAVAACMLARMLAG